MKSKKRKNHTAIIAILTVIIALAAIFTFVPMKFGNNTYTGVWGAIGSSPTVYAGMYAEYDIVGEASKNDIDLSMGKIKKVLQELGYQSSNVMSVNNSKIRVEIGYPQTVTNAFKNAYSTLSSVSIGSFEFRSANSGDDYVSVNGKDHVKEMSVGDYNGTTYLTVKFTKGGQAEFEKLCSASTTIYVYMGENMQTSFSASNVTDYSQMQLSIADYSSAKDFYFKALFGSINVELNSQTQIINTMTNLMGVGITESYSELFYVLVVFMAALVISGIIYLGVKYKIVAVLCLPIMMLSAVVTAWLFAGFTSIEISYSTLIAMILGISIMFTGAISYLHRIKEEYEQGKTIDASLQAGTKKARPAQIVTSGLIIVIGFILWCFIKGEVASAGLVFVVFGLLNALSNIIILPWFMWLFNKGNKKQGKPFGLKQQQEEEIC